MVYEPPIGAQQPPARPFVYPAISIADRYDVDYTPGGNTRGCNRFAEFSNENCDPQPHRLRRGALVLVGLDTAKFHTAVIVARTLPSSNGDGYLAVVRELRRSWPWSGDPLTIP